MKRLLNIAAAAALVTAIATPVMAQSWSDSNYRRAQHERWHDSNAFWPGEVAAGVVGGAVGTAGAIATAPFRASNSWGASYNGTNGYGPRGEFACQPGTWFAGEDGRRHICQ